MAWHGWHGHNPDSRSRKRSLQSCLLYKNRDVVTLTAQYTSHRTRLLKHVFAQTYSLQRLYLEIFQFSHASSVMACKEVFFYMLYKESSSIHHYVRILNFVLHIIDTRNCSQRCQK
jgi:hypothetical protein